MPPFHTRSPVWGQLNVADGMQKTHTSIQLLLVKPRNRDLQVFQTVSLYTLNY